MSIINIPRVGIEKIADPSAVWYFRDFMSDNDSARNEEMTFRKGKYYAIVANSPPIGIVESDIPFEGAILADEDMAGYRIGAVREGLGGIVIKYPKP